MQKLEGLLTEATRKTGKRNGFGKKHYGNGKMHSGGLENLTSMHDAVMQSREQLYECMKDSLAEEKETPIYNTVEKEVEVEKKVPVTISLFGATYEVPVLRKTIRTTETVAEKEQVGVKKELVYNQPENPGDVIPMVIEQAENYHRALSAYAEKFEGYKAMIDDVVRVHADAAEDATRKFESFLNEKDATIEAYKKAEETLGELREAIEKEGFKADTVISYDQHELALHDLAGRMYRLDESIPRYAHLKEIFQNKAKSYAGASAKCGVVADSLADTADAMDIIFKGQMEMESLVDVVGKALHLSTGATTDMENTFQYSRHVINEIAQLQLPGNADFKGVRDVSGHEVQHGVNMVNMLPERSESIDAVKDVVVGQYVGK
ncbi:MAG: hypothetical protein ACMXYE_00065 [Candidatus Woesearchaeota archaeon]